MKNTNKKDTPTKEMTTEQAGKLWSLLNDEQKAEILIIQGIAQARRNEHPNI